VGGSEYGHHTLTRFFAMHTGVLPALLVIFLAAHIAVFRKHGITTHPRPGDKNEYFWPKQVLFDAVGCLVLLIIVLFCVIHWDVPNAVQGTLPMHHLGAELGAPADPSEPYDAARPEWYYLFLFQLLKYFHGTQEVIGALVIPGIAMTILALAPFIGISRAGHYFNVSFIVTLLVAAGILTVLALREDANNPDFQKAKLAAAEQAERTHALINRREWIEDEVTPTNSKLSDRRMIQKLGAGYLLRNDPLLQGPKLFAQHCASCHDYRGPELPKTEGDKSGDHEHRPSIRFANQKLTPKSSGKGDDAKVDRDAAGKVVYPDTLPYSGAPNLYGVASREWLKDFLDPQKLTAVTVSDKTTPSPDPKIAKLPDHPDNHHRPIISDYFGHTNHREGRMAAWLKSHVKELEEKAKFTEGPDQNLKFVESESETVTFEVQAREAIAAALSAQAKLRKQADVDKKDAELIKAGILLIQKNCTNECHRFGDSGQLGLAPDLTGYGSYEWILGLVSNPEHERFYGSDNDRMPAFAKNLDKPAGHTVSVRELSLIVAWLRGEYYDPHDKQPLLPPTEEFARMTVVNARAADTKDWQLVGIKKTETSADVAQKLFVHNCSQCHNPTDAAGVGIVGKQSTAPNLHGFGSRAWVMGLFDPKQIDGPRFFGNTKKHVQGDMVGFVKDNFAGLDDDGKKMVSDITAALSAEAKLPSQADVDKAATDDGSIMRGKAAFETTFSTASCVDCHKFHDKGDVGAAPELTGWASQDWLERFIADPNHAQFYGEGNERMPAFGKSGPGEKKSLLTKEEITLVAKWLRGEKLD
jgi:ubiquinol-cytochrome c reductase cytochrome b subunit